MAKSKYQAYETETINRSDIKNAPYNPRIMDEDAKKRLRKNIAKHGLVSALTWNKRTGNLVGGHQRLEQLDSLERSKDYELTVCVVDVDEKEEATLNVQLNNPSMQGWWDMDKLADMTDDFDCVLEIKIPRKRIQRSPKTPYMYSRWSGSLAYDFAYVKDAVPAPLRGFHP